MKNKNKSGFVSMTLVYTFLIVFLFLMLAILNAYTEKNRYLEAIDEKINNDLIDSQQSKNTLISKLLSDNTPILDNNIKFHKVSNLHDGNGNGLFYTEDKEKIDMNDDGFSSRMYYFRGEVENNYMVLGSSCFRIMRTNEDGNVRIRYAGEYMGSECPQTGTKVSIGTSSYNSDNTNAEKVGYMYGDLTSGDSISKSDIKDILDNWYIENFIGKGTSIYVTDTMFCNNKKVINEENGSIYYNSSNLIPKIVDQYNLNEYADNLQIENLTFKCENKDDRYTLSSLSYGNDFTGNMLLDYPVGLVTMEDLIYSGGVYNINNEGYYMYTGSSYWTMSPFSFETTAKNVYVDNNGSIKSANINEQFDVIPVLSISSNTIIYSGNGEYNKPYIVK